MLVSRDDQLLNPGGAIIHLAIHEIEEIIQDIWYSETASGEELKRQLEWWMEHKGKSAQS